MDSSNEARHSAAHYFLEGLNEIGFDYLFCNFGTDHAPLIEAMAAFKRADRPAPATILCPHENTAVHMAAGYAIATGRGQGVMVHVDAGTANSAMALHNLCRARIPVLLMAGKAPFTTRGELLGTRDTYVHFVQEPFDQASVVRPYTKWEYNLPSGVIAKEALRRAHTVMQSDPRGPVYLTFPRETLTELWSEGQIRSYPAERFGPVAAGAADSKSIDAIVTQAADGRAALADLVLCRPQPCHGRADRRAGALRRHPGGRVQSSLRQPAARFALPRRLHAGQGAGRGRCRPAGRCRRTLDPERHAGQSQHLVGAYRRRCREAQFPDVDLPRQPAPAGRQPSHSHRPSGRAEGQGRSGFKARAAERVKRMAEEGKARREQAAKAAATPGTVGQINPHFLCAALAKALKPSDIVLNEAIRNGPVVAQQMPRTKPGTLVGLAGGGLGFSGGMALGLKLAMPERTIVQIAGDGTFYFSNPQSTLAVSRHYKLPVLTVVLDNSGWAAVKEATLRVYPDGEAKAGSEFGATLAPDMDFSKVAEAAGAHGELVSDPAAVEGAIARCLDAVRSGRSAVLHAKVTKL